MSALDWPRIGTHILVGERTDELRLASRQGSLPVEHLDRNIDLALLQRQLGKRGHGCLAFGVDLQRLPAQGLRRPKVILPLEQGKTLVDQRQDIHVRRLGLLQLDCLVELLNGLVKLALVEQELAASSRVRKKAWKGRWGLTSN